VKKFRSKIVVVFVMLAMMICFAASVQADDGPNGSQGGTLSTGAPPPAPPPTPTHLEIDWYYLLLLTIMVGF
jgi:hypothetical protein